MLAPSLPELYTVQARILKHAGDPEGAAIGASKAESMDLADRSAPTGIAQNTTEHCRCVMRGGLERDRGVCSVARMLQSLAAARLALIPNAQEWSVLDILQQRPGRPCKGMVWMQRNALSAAKIQTVMFVMQVPE